MAIQKNSDKEKQEKPKWEFKKYQIYLTYTK